MKRVLLGLGAAGVAGLAYSSLIERNSFGLRRHTIPCLSAGSAPMRVLHLSDPHLLLRQSRKKSFIAGLAACEPDLVIHTGDTLGGADGVQAAIECFDPLLDFPGMFCFGSNDYFAPVAKNPLKYFFRSHKRVHGTELPWRTLRDALTIRGWVDLNNDSTVVTLADGRTVAARGVDDPHIKRDDLDAVAGFFPTADLRLGLVHAPEPAVLDAFAADGAQLMLCGHTHGGQLRVPGIGALVTNCGIDRARAMGPSRYGQSWLHVSPGLGTSPYAPVRFACPPRASLLTLVAA